MKKFEDARGIGRVEISRRFVGQKERRTVDQGAGHGSALHFAPAHLVGKGVSPRGQPDQLEHLAGPGAGLLGPVAAQEERELDVLHGSHGREEVEKLEDDAQTCPAVGGEGFFICGVQGESVDGDLSGGRLIESAEKVEQGAFAAAAWSGHCTERMRGNFQRDIAQGVHFPAGRGINAGDMTNADHRVEEIFCSARRAQDNFRVVAEGSDWIVVDKPAGLLIHPTRPDGMPTLWKGLCQLLAYELANRGQISIITRLDRETSGLVLLALSSERARAFGLAMQRGLIGKEYLAVVRGWPDWSELVIEAPIIRQGEVRETSVWLKRCVDERGLKAVTEFLVQRRFAREGERFAVLRAKPRTGRTHQIRLHAAHAGFPLVGDKLYGGREGGAYLEFIDTGWTPKLAEELLWPRHALHAIALEFDRAGGRQRVSCPLAEDLAEFVGESGERFL